MKKNLIPKIFVDHFVGLKGVEPIQLVTVLDPKSSASQPIAPQAELVR